LIQTSSEKALVIERRACMVWRISVLIIGISLHLPAQPDQPRMPMQAKLEDGAEYRWLQKKVLASRLLDNMEDISTWSFKGEGDMALSTIIEKMAARAENSIQIQHRPNRR